MPRGENEGGLVVVAGDGDRYLSRLELVAYSGFSLRTLERLMNRDTDPLPHYRIGHRYRIRRSEYDAWLKRQGDIERFGTSEAALSFRAKVADAVNSRRRR